MTLRHISVFLRGALMGSEPSVVDHVKVEAQRADWRDEALKTAAQRYGRPFKCAATDMKREVKRPDGMVVADSPEVPKAQPIIAIVTDLRKQSGRLEIVVVLGMGIIVLILLAVFNVMGRAA